MLFASVFYYRKNTSTSKTFKKQCRCLHLRAPPRRRDQKLWQKVQKKNFAIVPPSLSVENVPPSFPPSLSLQNVPPSLNPMPWFVSLPRVFWPAPPAPTGCGSTQHPPAPEAVYMCLHLRLVSVYRLLRSTHTVKNLLCPLCRNISHVGGILDLDHLD